VVVASGSGPQAEIAPEMAAFAQIFGFEFRAHAIGDANRSARVERPFYYVERNFRSPDLRDFQMTPVSKNSGKAHRFRGG